MLAFMISSSPRFLSIVLASHGTVIDNNTGPNLRPNWGREGGKNDQIISKPQRSPSRSYRDGLLVEFLALALAQRV